MAYSVTSKKTGKVYFLHGKTTATKGGERTIYYFAGQVGEGALENLPDGVHRDREREDRSSPAHQEEVNPK
jgi:hypothetical protein